MIDYSKKISSDGNTKILGIWHKAVLKLFKFDNKSVVDIGCGSGSFLLAIKDKAKNVLGIDPNKANYEKLLENGIAGINDYPEKVTGHDSSFDIATCFEVIEHLYTHTDIIKAMSKMLQVGGEGIITTPNAFNIARAIAFLFKQEHHDILLDPTRSAEPEHIRLWSYGMMKRICDKEPELKVEHVYGVGTMFGKLQIYTNEFMIRLFSQHLIVVFKKIKRQ